MALFSPAAPADKPARRSKERADAPVALVAVSVFREPGFAVAGAGVALAAAEESSGAKSKQWNAVADARGEYVFRVPVSAMKYSVTASAKGLKPEKKTVAVEGEGRFDVTFMLEPESK
jgi:hypothetical protein